MGNTQAPPAVGPPPPQQQQIPMVQFAQPQEIPGQAEFHVFRNVAPHRRRGGLGHHRVRYTAGQKENAIRLLNLGLSYRQVARMTSPHCSSGTPHRWRREHLRREEQRRRMDELRRRRRW